MSTFTTTLARCTQRDADNVLCWGVLATQDGSRFIGELPCGHVAGEWLVVNGTYNPDYPCDPACVYARGAECICSCGGGNHGCGWIVPPNDGQGGIFNDTAAFRKWMDEAGRRHAIENVAGRHKAARIAAETRFLRNEGLWIVLNAVGQIAGAYMDCLYDDLNEHWQDLEADLRADIAEAKEIEHARRVAASTWLGEPGEKLVLSLRLVRVQEFATSFGFQGTQTLHTFETPEGAIVKWWTASDSPWMLEPGSNHDDTYRALVADWNETHPERRRGYSHSWKDNDGTLSNDEIMGHDARICGYWYALGADLTVRATVKAHGEYNGIKDTTVTRVAVPAEKPARKGKATVAA